MSEDLAQRLRALPAVDRLAQAVLDAGGPTATKAEAVAVARATLERRRAELLAGATDDPDLVRAACELLRPSLRRVLNGTGVVVHTNLGRAPLHPDAAAAAAAAGLGYVNLELDLDAGGRGVRDAHVADLLVELTGAQDALVVNNGAAAVLLAVAAIAGAGGSIVVSRGQAVEIGGGFRIPDVVAQAAARLVEVGTTNRTRRDDYRRAVDDGAGAVLRVHPSNFRTIGFVEDVEIEDLCTLGVPVIDDIGSGLLAEHMGVPGDEPAVRRSVAAGATVVCFSGDKLLGGPQAGLIVGTAEGVAACRRHPLARALRVGRLPLAALAATLALYRDQERARREIPVLAMLTADEAELRRRAARLAHATGGDVVEAKGRVGGGALPLVELSGPAVALPETPGGADALAAALRRAEPPLLARIAHDRVLVDPRTLGDDELDAAAAVIVAAVRSS